MSEKTEAGKIELYNEKRIREQKMDQKREKIKIKTYLSSKLKRKDNTHEKIEIPIIKLKKPEIKVKEIKIDKTIPEIEEKEIEIDIPIVVLEKPKIEVKDVKLDYNPPEIPPSKGRNLEIPVIRLNKPKEVRCSISTFDEKLPQILPKIEGVLRVPIYRAPKPVTREIISSFDSRIDTQILQQLTGKEKETRIEIPTEEKTNERVSAENEPSSSGKEIKEIPDIIDLIFGVSSSKLSSKGPKIVLYRELEKDSTIGSFETLCIRIYREKVGGYPRLKPVKELDEFNVMEIEKWMDAHGSLFTIDLDCNKKKVREWFTQNNLREPVRRAIIGDVGFIIFKTRDAELYDHCKKVLERLEKEIEHPLDVIYIEPRQLSFEEKKEFSSLVWGCINLDPIPPIFVEEKGVERPYGATFDDIFNKHAQREFEKRLENLKGSTYSLATKPHEGEESPEHKQMKWFVVKYLTRELIKKGIIKAENPKRPKKYEISEVIKTEEDTKDFLNGVIADVMDTNSKEVYEVETLFAQDNDGKTVEEKIIYTIEKYEGLADVRKINIIMDNFTFLRHLKTLIDIKDNEPEEIREKVEFYTLDLEKGRLAPLKEIERRLRNLQAKIERSIR
jgi:hypothetical protein